MNTQRFSTSSAASAADRGTEEARRKRKGGAVSGTKSSAGRAPSEEKTAGAEHTASAGPSYREVMEKYYAGLYEDALAENGSTEADAVSAAESDAQRAVERIRSSGRSTDRQLYREYMENLRTLPQRLAALGIAGGLAESSRVRLASSYGESVAESARERSTEEAKAYAERDSRVAAAKSERRKADAEAKKTREESRAALLRETENRRGEYAEKIAALLASAGDYSGYLQLGLTKEQAEFLRKAFGK